VVVHSRRRNDTAWVVQTIDEDILAFPAHILILHLGIVDGFPRLFNKREHAILDGLKSVGLGFITRFVTRLASRNRPFITRHFQKFYVRLPDFERNLHTILQAVQQRQLAQHVILLGILDTTEENARRTYRAVESIAAYDAVLRRMTTEYLNVHYIDLNGYFKARAMMPILDDGHHLNLQAHPHVAALLEAEIRRLEGDTP
jgi:hypothetical protein